MFLNRALRSVLIAILVGIPIIWVAWGWRSMLMFVVGGAIAATGILEWRRLMAAVLVRLGPSRRARSTGSTRLWGRFCSGFLSVSWPPPDCFMLA